MIGLRIELPRAVHSIRGNFVPVKALALSLCVAAIATGCAHRNEAAPIRTGFAGYSDPAGDLARRSDDVLAKLDESPDNFGLLEQFWTVFDLAYLEPGYASSPTLGPEENSSFGNLLARASQYAEDGSSESLEKVMHADLGPFGQTAEGGERISEYLWNILEAQTQLTLDVLARLTAGQRDSVVEDVYLRPVHDGFAFDEVAEDLDQATIPPVLQGAALQMQTIALELSSLFFDPSVGSE